MEKIKKENAGLLINVQYLDDGSICGSAEDLHKALAIIEEEDGPLDGLNLNRAKSLLFVPENDSFSHNHLPSEIPVARGF